MATMQVRTGEGNMGGKTWRVDNHRDGTAESLYQEARNDACKEDSEAKLGL
jgi:hypothetical protein